MRTALSYIALPALVAVVAGCGSATAPQMCALHSTTSAFASTTPNVTGIVTGLKYSSGGNTPGGGTASQLDVKVMVPLGKSTSHITLNIVLSGSTPVFAQRGSGTPDASSACAIALGDKVSVWAPFSLFGNGYGDHLNTSEDSSSLASVSFVAVQVVIVR